MAWTTDSVSGTGQDYNDGDVQHLATKLATAAGKAGTATQVKATEPGSKGGTLTGTYKPGLYDEFEDYTTDEWQEIFDELQDIHEDQDWPKEMTLVLTDTSGSTPGMGDYIFSYES